MRSKLRGLSKNAQKPRTPIVETLALMEVGFMAIFREGFETTLFMRSIPIGLGIGAALIAIMGFAVFLIGAKLPYRKMLVFTGALGIFVLFTFVGSIVRLFQTVGWLPVHPVSELQLPPWTSLWLGLFPAWEGILIPFASLAYIVAMWLWVKFSSWRGTSLEAIPKPRL